MSPKHERITYIKYNDENNEQRKESDILCASFRIVGRRVSEERMPKIPAEKDDGDTFMRQISELMTSEDYSPEKEQLRNAV